LIREDTISHNVIEIRIIAMSKSKYIIYKDDSGQWRWHFVSSANRIMAESTDEYSSRIACKIALDCYRTYASNAEVKYKKEKRRLRGLLKKADHQVASATSSTGDLPIVLHKPV
jgi:uncharacterized protein YegP (UPF0339 family)